MFRFLRRRYAKIRDNQIIVDYDTDVKRVLMIRTNGLTNNETIEALQDAVRCMGGKVKRRRRK